MVERALQLNQFYQTRLDLNYSKTISKVRQKVGLPIPHPSKPLDQKQKRVKSNEEILIKEEKSQENEKVNESVRELIQDSDGSQTKIVEKSQMDTSQDEPQLRYLTAKVESSNVEVKKSDQFEVKGTAQIMATGQDSIISTHPINHITPLSSVVTTPLSSSLCLSQIRREMKKGKKMSLIDRNFSQFNEMITEKNGVWRRSKVESIFKDNPQLMSIRLNFKKNQTQSVDLEEERKSQLEIEKQIMTTQPTTSYGLRQSKNPPLEYNHRQQFLQTQQRFRQEGTSLSLQSESPSNYQKSVLRHSIQYKSKGSKRYQTDKLEDEEKEKKDEYLDYLSDKLSILPGLQQRLSSELDKERKEWGIPQECRNVVDKQREVARSIQGLTLEDATRQSQRLDGFNFDRMNRTIDRKNAGEKPKYHKERDFKLNPLFNDSVSRNCQPFDKGWRRGSNKVDSHLLEFRKTRIEELMRGGGKKAIKVKGELGNLLTQHQEARAQKERQQQEREERRLGEFLREGLLGT